MKISSFVDFETALSIVRELNINSVSEWRKWIKENKDKKLPYNPDIIYKNNGWINFKHRIPYKKKNKIFKILSIELK